MSTLLFFTGVSRSSSKIIKHQSDSLSNEDRLNAMHKIKEMSYTTKEAILKGDFNLLYNTFKKAWEAKKKTSSLISNKSIDEIYNAALDSGAYCGKISGAGGGGFMLFFIDPTRKNEIIERLNIYKGHFIKVKYNNLGVKVGFPIKKLKQIMNNIELIKDQIIESVTVKNKILADEELMQKISVAADKLTDAYKNNNKTMLAGNGGSAADSQHIAGELVSRFMFNRPGLPSIALSTDTSILTAIGNDYGYDRLFARQIEAQGVQGDVFIGISTSGNSPNIIEALKACKQKEFFNWFYRK